MLNMKKCIMISAVEAMTVFVIVLAIKAVRHQHHSCKCEKTGIGIDERLKESKAALDKAAAHVQSVFEHINNHKK